MVNTCETYTGKGHNKLFEKVRNEGPLRGYIVRTSGHKVASVEFTIESGNLILRVSGTEYSSITSALHDNYNKWAVNHANGSDGSGDIANNIIGNYAIFKHVLFGNSTLEDIVSGDSSRASAKKGSAFQKPRIRNIDNCPANEVFFEKYTTSDAKMLQSKFGRELVIREFNILTLGEFEIRYGL